MGQWINGCGPLDSIVRVEEDLKIPLSFCASRPVLDFRFGKKFIMSMKLLLVNTPFGLQN
jgi:hypothetical protein